MKPFTRRGFLEAAAAAPLLGAGGRLPAERKPIKPSPQEPVKLSEDGLSLSPDETVDVLVNVNPTWNRTTAEILARHFREAV